MNLSAQNSSYTPKKHIDEDGTIYWNKALPIYLSISSTPDGERTRLHGQNPRHTDPLFLDTEGPNFIRTRYAVDPETKQVITPLAEVVMPVIADGSGPESTIEFLNADRHRAQQIQYFGPGLSLKIESRDRWSGVDLSLYKLDDGAFGDISGNIDITEEGDHTVSFYGVDKVGNKEETQSRTFILDLTAPAVTHNINGFADDNVIAATSKIYFTATDELSGVDRVYYRFDDENFKVYNGSQVRFSYLNDGDHVLNYYAVDEVGNTTDTFSYALYFDKTAPLTASDILGDRFVVDDRIYFSGRTKMKLTAVDNKIGVKEIRYAIDRGDFQVYDQPFYLPSTSGEHRIRYYSVDRLSNSPSGSEAYKHNISLVYLDLTGPTIRHNINGPFFEAAGVQYISPRTKVEIVGRDPESGLQYLAYSIDGASEETRFEEGFTISETGNHKIELFGYDNVNNRNIGSTEVFVDATPPVIYPNFSTQPVGEVDGLQQYPPYVTVFLAATDDIVGNDRIYYSINEGRETLYTKPLSRLQRNTKYKVSIRAVDMVGNEATTEIEFVTADK